MNKFSYHLSMVLLCLLPAIVSAQSEAIEFSSKKFNQVKLDARNQGKFIFVDFYAEWCGPCKWMEKNVFTDSAVVATLNDKYISLRVDAEKEEAALVQKLQITAYPTLAIYSPTGKLLVKREGAMPADLFNEMAKDVSNWSINYANYKKNPEKYDNVVPYAHSLKWANAVKAQRLVQNFLKKATEKKWSRPEYWVLIKEFVSGENLIFVEKINRNVEIKTNYPEEYAEFMRSALEQVLAKSLKIKSKYNFNKYLGYVNANKSIYSNSDSLILTSKIKFTELTDVSKLSPLLEQYIRKYEKGSYIAYSKYAAYIVENHFNKELLHEAIKWSKYSNSKMETLLSYTTLGLAYEKLNDYKPAYAHMLLAETKAQEQEDKKLVEEHLTRIKEKMNIEVGDGVTVAKKPNQKDDGRFTLGAGNKRLMYGYPVPSSTSHFVVNIDGKLATNSPRLAQKGLQHITGELSYGGSAMTPEVEISFEFNNVRIVQKLIPVDKAFKEVTSGLAQYYKVSYDFINLNGKIKNIGLGVLFDTMIDDNDHCYISADGDLLETEVGLAYKDVPKELLFYRTKADTSDMMGAAILSGNGATKPDKIVIGRWPVLHSVTWKLSPKNVRYGDSAYFLKWENERLDVNGTRNFATYYGLPAFKKPELRLLVEDESNLHVSHNVYFKHGYSTLDLNAKMMISRIIEKDDVIITGVLLNGYADVTGGEDHNFDLSKKRIAEVGKIFNAYSIPFMPKPYGNDRSEHTEFNEEYGNVWDRRVEIVIYYKPKRQEGILSEIDVNN